MLLLNLLNSQRTGHSNIQQVSRKRPFPTGERRSQTSSDDDQVYSEERERPNHGTVIIQIHTTCLWLMGRKIRTTVPTFHTNFALSWPDTEKLRQKDAESTDKLRTNFEQRHTSVVLEPLQPGTQVYIKNRATAGTVTGTAAGTAETPKSYTTEIDHTSHRFLEKSRKCLIPRNPCP